MNAFRTGSTGSSRSSTVAFRPETQPAATPRTSATQPRQLFTQDLFETAPRASSRAAQSASTEGVDQFLENAYQRLLGRSMDGVGAQTFRQKIQDMRAQGTSWEDIQQSVEADIKSSTEYAARQAPPASSTGSTSPATTGTPSGTPSSTPVTTGSTPASSSEPVPGAEKAIAYAQNPGINPNTGTNEWAYWCLALVNQAYGGGTDGMLRAETATGAYNNYANAGRIQTEGNPPRGALVFFDYKGQDGVDYGHVGISMGDGTYIGTTTDGTNTGVRSIDGNLPYKGWAYP